MAIRTQAEFTSLYLTTSGQWPNNSTGEITPERLREGITDTWDSFINQDTVNSGLLHSQVLTATSGYIAADLALSGTLNNKITDVSGVASTNTSNIATMSGRNAVLDSILSATTSGFNYIDFASGVASPSWKEGRVFYDTNNHTYAIYTDKSDVTLQLGQETHIRAVNKTLSTIPNGTVVAVTGAQGNRPKIEPALATPEYAYFQNIIGVTTHDIPVNEEGLVTVRGTVEMNTSTFGDGSGLYLSTTTSGAMTLVEPPAPNHIIRVGYALNTTTNGRILVQPLQYPHLEQLSNVDGTNPVSGSLLVYNKQSGVWDPSTAIVVDPSGLVLTSSGFYGVRLNPSSPVFGWKDLVGQIVPRTGGAPAPGLAAYRGANVLSYHFDAGDKIDNICYHMPHDYLPASDMFIHVHWGHNGTSITGVFALNYYIEYAKGYNQAGQIFNSQVTLPQTISGIVNTTTHPRWGHFINEIQMTSNGGSSSTLDRNILEVDGLINVAIEVITKPTIAGGTVNPFIFMIDIHYQTNGVIGTLNKNYPFYT